MDDPTHVSPRLHLPGFLTWTAAAASPLVAAEAVPVLHPCFHHVFHLSVRPSFFFGLSTVQRFYWNWTCPQWWWRLSSRPIFFFEATSTKVQLDLAIAI